MSAENSGHLQRAAGLMRRAAIASVGVSLFLVAIKAFAYFASHSVAMRASTGTVRYIKTFHRG